MKTLFTKFTILLLLMFVFLSCGLLETEDECTNYETTFTLEIKPSVSTSIQDNLTSYRRCSNDNRELRHVEAFPSVDSIFKLNLESHIIIYSFRITAESEEEGGLTLINSDLIEDYLDTNLAIGIPNSGTLYIEYSSRSNINKKEEPSLLESTNYISDLSIRDWFGKEVDPFQYIKDEEAENDENTKCSIGGYTYQEMLDLSEEYVNGDPLNHARFYCADIAMRLAAYINTCDEKYIEQAKVSLESLENFDAEGLCPELVDLVRNYE